MITASQAQSIGCRRQALFVLPITEAHTGGELVWSGSETSGELTKRNPLTTHGVEAWLDHGIGVRCSIVMV